MWLCGRGTDPAYPWRLGQWESRQLGWVDEQSGSCQERFEGQGRVWQSRNNAEDAADQDDDRESVMEHEELTGKIIGCAMTVHRSLGPGFLESVYQKALAHELGKAGIRVECECPINVRYDGVDVGTFSADMLVEGKVLVENKAVRAMAVVHEVQLVNYLTATGIDVGPLLNFGAARLGYKRKTREPRTRV